MWKRLRLVWICLWCLKQTVLWMAFSETEIAKQCQCWKQNKDGIVFYSLPYFVISWFFFFNSHRSRVKLQEKLFRLNYLFKNYYLNDDQKVLFLQLKRIKVLKLQSYYKSMKKQVPTTFLRVLQRLSNIFHDNGDGGSNKLMFLYRSIADAWLRIRHCVMYFYVLCSWWFWK